MARRPCVLGQLQYSWKEKQQLSCPVELCAELGAICLSLAGLRFRWQHPC